MRELAALVFSGWSGAVVAGFATFVLSGGGVHDGATEAGSLVLVLALLPVLLTLIPGVLCQVAAAPNKDFSFHVDLAFFAGVVYCLGWLLLVVTATSVGQHLAGATSAIAWCYYLVGPIALPAALGVISERFQRSGRDA